MRTSKNPFQYGDIIINTYGNKAKVLGIVNDIVFVSCNDNHDAADASPWHYQELIKQGWRAKNQELTSTQKASKKIMDEIVKADKELQELRRVIHNGRDVIQIDGKDYYEDEVLEKLKELEPIE